MTAITERVTVKALALCGDDGRLEYMSEGGFLIDFAEAWKEYGRHDYELAEVEITYTPLPPVVKPPRGARVPRTEVMAVECPRCHAAPGARCWNAKRRYRNGSLHKERRATALAARAEQRGEEVGDGNHL